MPPPDFSQRKDVRKAEKLAVQATAARISFTKRIMSEVQGREWMHGLLEKGHLFGSPFVRGAPDLTAYNLGEQEFAKEVFWEIVNHCPTEYVQMMQEASIREISHGRRTDATDRTGAGESERSPDADRRIEGSDPDLDPAVWDGREDELGRIGG